MKQQNLFENDWDVLIILDACRYDYFEKIYPEYLEGKLEKRESKGSNTGEWLTKTFTDYYDLKYISSNPYVNSLGIPLSECNPKFDYDWKATDHFSEIIDVWFDRWDRDIGTVHPRELNMVYFQNDNEKRVILHYLQPHLPYLSKNSVGTWGNTIFRVKNKAGKQKGILKKLRRWFRPRFKETIGKTNYWKFRQILDLEPRNPFEDAWRKGDSKEIKKHYEENLRIVLDTVKNLVREVDKKIVITADHGEGFGEKNIWGHPRKKQESFLKTVPWFIVDN